MTRLSLKNEPDTITAPITELDSSESPPVYTPKPNITTTTTNATDREAQWKEALEALKTAMITYDQTSKTKGPEHAHALEATASDVVDKMRRLGDMHTDPAVKKEWGERAEKFAKAGQSERGIMSNDIVKGLAILLATPFALVGAVLFAAGTIVYGAGSLVKGLGNLLTWGRFSGENVDKNKNGR